MRVMFFPRKRFESCRNLEKVLSSPNRVLDSFLLFYSCEELIPIMFGETVTDICMFPKKVVFSKFLQVILSVVSES